MGTTERTSQLSASPDLFDNSFLNFFSRVHPAVPAVIFIPIIGVMYYLAIDAGSSALAEPKNAVLT